MSTIADVAARAGVGIGTVSRVLNDSPQVRPETRARILAAIDELGYHPRRRTLRDKAELPRYVGVLVPFFAEPAAYQRLRGIVDRLSPHGFEVVLFNVESVDRARSRLLELPRQRHLEGLIVVSLPLRPDEGERLADGPFPTVLVDTAHPALRSVTIDDREGGRVATEHLLGLGHERLAFIGEPRANAFGFVSSARREDGFRAALAEAGIDVADRMLRFGPHLRSAAKQLAMELFAQSPAPTGIVAASDTQAIGVLEAARDTGRIVPGELSVVGYDDIELAAHVGLTTVRQPLLESGHRGAELLLDAIAGAPLPPGEEHLALELVVRSTTATPVGAGRRRARAVAR